MTEHSHHPSQSPDLDFDFRFRPDYGLPDNPVPLILGNMTGELRRRAQEMSLREGDGGGEPLGEEDREEVLCEERRAELASVHPWLMGGEYLPEAEDGDVEIARIVLASTTMDVVSIRARRRGDIIHYSALDEYEGAIVHLPPLTSVEPLNFGEMVKLVNAMQLKGWFEAESYLDQVRELNLSAGTDPATLVNFAWVESSFYPKLGAFFERRAEEWLEKELRKREE